MASTQFSTKKLVVIGVGLIGGSLAIAARQRNLCERVIGIVRSESIAHRAVELGVVDEAHTSIEAVAERLGEGDVLFIAVPTLSMRGVFESVRECVSPEVTITDGASVKGSVFSDAQAVFGAVPPQLVLGHPIAGSEKSGVEAANPELYVDHRVILTPTPETAESHLKRVTKLWQDVGAEVLELGVEDHDEILASTSHLPHAIAYSLVDTLAHDSQNQNIFRYAAGGFRDFTRIASSDATMWRDIMLANDKAVVSAIDLFSANLARMKQAILSGDGQALTGIFTRAKAARDHFTKMLEQRAYMEKEGAESLTQHFKISRGNPLKGDIQVPGDKSISHRAVMLGALAEGVTRVEGVLESEDILATVQAFRDMGVVIEGPHEGRLTIYGVGMRGLSAPVGPIYVGNSGTSMRLLSGILAAQSFDSELVGDESLNRRPMARVAEPLSAMGAVIATAEGGCAPLKIKGGQALQGIKYTLPVASAQVKSAILLAGMFAKGETQVTEPQATRDHTERMLEGFGYAVKRVDSSVYICGGGSIKAADFEVPGDISSAAFFMVAATIVPDSDLLIRKVCINPTRAGIIEILRLMGANISLQNMREIEGEPVADVRVCFAELKGIVIPQSLVTSAIDEFPAVFVAAACAEGITDLHGANELRVKESDRLEAMASGLRALGIDCETRPDGMSVTGGLLRGGEVSSCGDHRVAMALAIAGLRAQSPVVVKDCSKVATSFPGFAELAKKIGISLEVLDA